jgi:hypothetical protein
MDDCRAVRGLDNMVQIEAMVVDRLENDEEAVVLVGRG